MGKNEAVNIEVSMVSLRSIVAVVLKDESEKWQFVEGLTWIGCEGLLIQPWSLKSEDMVREFSQERSNEWEGTIRRDLERWTADMWAEFYSFLKEGKGQVFRTDKFVDGKFSTPINPKDGHAVVDCVDPREKRVLKFIIPILYLEKPTRITMTVANTIFGALSGIRKVGWGLMMQEASFQAREGETFSHQSLFVPPLP